MTELATGSDGFQPGIHRIPLSLLQAIEPYQRQLQELNVRRIVNNFDERFLDRLVVVQYPQHNIAICDGHHRAEACRRLFGLEYKAESVVVPVKTVAEAARLARFIDGLTNLHSRPEADRQLEVGEDAETLHLRDLIQSSGYVMDLASGNAQWNAFTSISPLRQIWKSHGREGDQHVIKVLTLLADLWEGQREVKLAKVVLAMSDFLDHIAISSGYKEERLLAALQGKRLKEALDGIKGRTGSQAQDFADWIATYYNMNRAKGTRKITRSDTIRSTKKKSA